MSNAHPRDSVEHSRRSLVHAKSLLEKALQIIDEHANAAELGARLQEVIDGLSSRID